MQLYFETELFLCFISRSFSSVMSTDTDDEGQLAVHDLDPVVGHQDDIDEPLGDDHDPLNSLLITANVGSIFEDCEQLVPTWRKEVLKHIEQSRAKFVAIHFQEVKGIL